MQNRGPDHRDFCHLPTANRHLYLLHSRLSIIDLDPRSNQPFQKGPATLAYNGEIYNYPEIRKTLEQKGHRFQTKSDTEVLLENYLDSGPEGVGKLEGMWSFALFDDRTSRLLLSRDRFGEKPLYVLEDETGIFFGSEIKLLKALSGQSLRVNYRQVHRYLVNGYKSLYKTRDTFFEKVREIRPGHNLLIGPDGSATEMPYWKPRIQSREMTEAEAVEGARERLLESVRLRLRSDVPLAFCLSGGVDAAGLVSIAAKSFNRDVATFSIIDKDERYDESDNIRATLNDLGCRHTLIEFT